MEQVLQKAGAYRQPDRSRKLEHIYLTISGGSGGLFAERKTHPHAVAFSATHRIVWVAGIHEACTTTGAE
jgi:hypothetical protein